MGAERIGLIMWLRVVVVNMCELHCNGLILHHMCGGMKISLFEGM